MITVMAYVVKFMKVLFTANITV